MDDPSQFLLTKKKQMYWLNLLSYTKNDYTKIEGTWLIIGKYKERLWFQKIWYKNEPELLMEYLVLAHQLERLEATIEECKTALYMHNCAKEILHKSMRPFENINLKEHELIQIELF